MMMRRLLPLLLFLFLAAPLHAQQLNPGGEMVVQGASEGVFTSLMVGPVTGGAPIAGTVNALQYEINGVPLSVATMGDYAAGPWTPTLVGTSGGPATYAVQSGSFEKIGRQVTVRFYVGLTNLGGLAGNVAIGNLPYPNNNTTNDMGICSMSVWTGVTMTAGYTQLAALVTQGQSMATLYAAGSGQGPLVVQGANLGNGTILVGMCNYHI